MADDVAIELARLEREALCRVQARMAAQQRGEAFLGRCGAPCCVLDGACCGCCRPFGA